MSLGSPIHLAWRKSSFVVVKYGLVSLATVFLSHGCRTIPKRVMLVSDPISHITGSGDSVSGDKVFQPVLDWSPTYESLGEYSMSTTFITFGLLTVALKLFAESMELFVKTDDVLNRPKSAKRLMDSKAILNVLAGITAVVAALAPFFGLEQLGWAVIVTLFVLLALTALVYLLVRRETPVGADDGIESNVNPADDELVQTAAADA